MMKTERQVIGLIPAGGTATRIAPLPCSKELFPLGFRSLNNGENLRPKVVCHYLLEKMKIAGTRKVFIILRDGKWDIPSYLGDGTTVGIPIAYLMMGLPYGTPYTLDQAFPFVKDDIVLFGFGDVIFQPDDTFVHLLNHQAKSNADVVLGVFPATHHPNMDVVDLDNDGRVKLIEIKPPLTNLKYSWLIAVWTPLFTHFMHEYLSDLKSRHDCDEFEDRELYVGDVVQAAIQNGLTVQSVRFPDKNYIDIGTPEDLAKAVRKFSK